MDVLTRTYANEEFREFVEQHPDKRYELIDGVIVEVPSPRPFHGLIAAQILYFLIAYLKQNKIGYAIGESYDFELSPGNVFQPDAAFISRTRLPEIPDRFQIAPDLAVEVVSPGNTAREIQHKIETYIRFGTQIVWVVYPEQKAVYVHRPEPDGSLNQRKLTDGDRLDGNSVLPGFSISVNDIFEDIENK